MTGSKYLCASVAVGVVCFREFLQRPLAPRPCLPPGYIARAGRDIEGRAQIKDRYEARLAEYEEENAAFTETLAEYDEKVANFNRLTTIAT